MKDNTYTYKVWQSNPDGTNPSFAIAGTKIVESLPQAPVSKLQVESAGGIVSWGPLEHFPISIKVFDMLNGVCLVVNEVLVPGSTSFSLSEAMRGRDLLVQVQAVSWYGSGW